MSETGAEHAAAQPDQDRGTSQQQNGQPTGGSPADPDYRTGKQQLLGVIAYGELAAFQRLAEDANKAPTLPDKVMISSMASQQFQHFDQVRRYLLVQDVDVMELMEPFHQPFDAWHEFTHPKTWLEGLVKAFVGDGIASDFYREIAAYLDPDARELIFEVLANDQGGDYLVGRVRQAISEDPAVAGRLALWGRRLMGEALTQAQQVAGQNELLTNLLAGTLDRPGMDLAAIQRMFSRLVENHQLRMERLGLDA